MRPFYFFFTIIAVLSLISCESRQEAYSGIADENGIVTNNSRPVPKKEKKSMRELGSEAADIIPDW